MPFKLILLYTIIFSSYYSPLSGMQRVTPVAPSQNYLKTISRWATENPLSIAAIALGTSSALGYIFYQPLKNYFSYKLVPFFKPQPVRPITRVGDATLQQRKFEIQGIICPEPYPRFATISPLQKLAFEAPNTNNLSSSIDVPNLHSINITSHTNAEYEKISASINPLIRAIQTLYTHNPTAGQVIHWYNAGRIVLHKIKDGSLKSLSDDQIKELLWFIYIYAAAQKNPYKFFDEGTFKLYGVHEDINPLYAALVNTHAYRRFSSHFKEWFPNDFFGEHYGIDIEGLPPRTMGTIVFAKNPAASEIYIKPEPDGLGSIGGLVGHTVGYGQSIASKTLPSHISEALSLPKDEGEALSKERIPDTLKVFVATQVDPIQAALGRSVEETKLLKKDMLQHGVRVIYPKVIDYLTSEELKKHSPDLYATIQQFYNENLTHYDTTTWQRKKGNEEVVNISELLEAGPLAENEIGIARVPLQPEQETIMYAIKKL